MQAEQKELPARPRGYRPTKFTKANERREMFADFHWMKTTSGSSSAWLSGQTFT